MPEMTFRVRWPDGACTAYYSPSLVVHDHLTEGASYSVTEFTERVRAAMAEAGERVRAKYGIGCTSAAATSDQVRETAARHGADARVEVLTLSPALEDA